MQAVRQHRALIWFVALLVFCSVMVVHQVNANQTRHVELREAFILLHSRGYATQAEHLYRRLLRDLEKLPDRALLDDFQRTMMVVDPSRDQPRNLVWQYHWTVSNELDKRSAGALRRALELARRA